MPSDAPAMQTTITPNSPHLPMRQRVLRLGDGRPTAGSAAAAAGYAGGRRDAPTPPGRRSLPGSVDPASASVCPSGGMTSASTSSPSIASTASLSKPRSSGSPCASSSASSSSSTARPPGGGGGGGGGAAREPKAAAAPAGPPPNGGM